MKLYGLDYNGKSWNTRGCCAGHDLFPAPRAYYGRKRNKRYHHEATKLAHRLARHTGKYELYLLIQEELVRE